jgi:PAS domain S-box-containing protein
MRKYEKKIICFSVLAAALFWMIDVLYDYFYINYDESFAYVLFYDLKTHGFLIRPLVIGVFIILGCVIARYVTKSKGMEERYQELFNNINDCTFVFPFSDNRWQANFTEVNASACTRWGYDKKELLQLSLGSLVQDEDCSEISPLWERLKDDYHIFFETGLVTKSGDKVPVEVSAHIVRLGEQPHVLAIVRDITARKRGEEEILRLASFPQFSPTPILEVNAAGKINYCNIAAQETLKRLGIDELEAFLPDDLPQVLKMAREGGVSQFYREKSLKGALFGEFIHFVPQYSVLRIFPVNITVRRRAENALRESEQHLLTLTARLLSIQETERRRISSELHDELGQGLTYLKLQLGAIKAKMRKDQNQLKKDCQSLLNYLDGIIENVRRLSWDLSPTVLEEMGLSSAMKYWLEEFSKYYNVKNLAVNIEEIDNLFSSKVQLNIYRIFQECLTNIGKHAQATQISLAVKKQDGRVSFVVKDNGQGFDVEKALTRESSSKGIGLATMAERVRMAGGVLDISSHRGLGTQITFTIPTDARRKPEDVLKYAALPNCLRR